MEKKDEGRIKRRKLPNVLRYETYRKLSNLSFLDYGSIRWKDPDKMLPPSYSKTYYSKKLYYEDHPERPVHCLILIDWGDGIWGDVGFYDYSKKTWCFADYQPIETPLMGKVVAWAEYPTVPFIFEYLLPHNANMIVKNCMGLKRNKKKINIIQGLNKPLSKNFLESIKDYIFTSIEEDKERPLWQNMETLLSLDDVQKQIRSILRKNSKKLRMSLNAGSKKSSKKEETSSGRTGASIPDSDPNIRRSLPKDQKALNKSMKK